jgi:hypothetical protein
MAPDGYLDLPALAAYSSLSERTLRSFLSDETHPLPHYRLSGRGKVVIRASDFNAWFLRYRTEGPVKAKLDRIIEELRN